MTNQKIYLPRDENPNLFKIRTSDNAILIFLDYFGYPNLHLTFYIKELPEDERLFDLHLTDEKTGEKLYQNSIKINIPKTEKKIQEKLFELNDDFIKLIQEHKKKSIDKKDLVCLNCFVEDQEKFPEKLDNKEYAKEFYSGIFNKTIKFDVEKLKTCVKCNNSKHDIFMDKNLTNMYMKNAMGIFTFKDQVEFSNNLVNLIREKFKDELNKFEKVAEEIKNKLKEYKYEN